VHRLAALLAQHHGVDVDHCQAGGVERGAYVGAGMGVTTVWLQAERLIDLVGQCLAVNTSQPCGRSACAVACMKACRSPK
jgi:hypothetical protein